MKSFAIYKDPESGEIGAMEIPSGGSFDKASAIIKNSGYDVERPHALIGESEEDALNRYDAAKNLRKKAAYISKRGELQKENISQNERLNAEQQGGIYSEKDPSIGNRLLNLLKTPQIATVAAAEMPFIGKDEYSSNLYRLYSNPNELETVATDPALLVPTPFEKISAAGKIGKYAIRPIADALTQSAVEAAEHGLSGEDGAVGDVAKNAAYGSAIGAGMNAAGGAIGKYLHNTAERGLMQKLKQNPTKQKAMVSRPITPHELWPYIKYNTIEWGDVGDRIEGAANNAIQRQSDAIPGLTFYQHPSEILDELLEKYRTDFSKKKIRPEEMGEIVNLVAHEKKFVGRINEAEEYIPEILEPSQVINVKRGAGELARYDQSNMSKLAPKTRAAREFYRDYTSAVNKSIAKPYKTNTSALENYDKYMGATHELSRYIPIQDAIVDAAARNNRGVGLTDAIIGAGVAGSGAAGNNNLLTALGLMYGAAKAKGAAESIGGRKVAHDLGEYLQTGNPTIRKMVVPYLSND